MAAASSPSGSARREGAVGRGPGGTDDDEVTRPLAQAFSGLGICGDDPETERTPERVAKLYRQLLRGLDAHGAPVLSLTPHRGTGLVVVGDVPFYSLCAHHLLPFFGQATVAYLPHGQVAGLSNIVDVVDYFAARPQLQERLAEQIADHLEAALRPDGLRVHLAARHMCVEMRGPRRRSLVEYTATRGRLPEAGACRDDDRQRGS